MIEAFIMGVGGFAVVWGLWRVCDAGAGGWGGYRDPEKWAVNPRVMRWLLPLIAAGISAYLVYLKVLGLI